MSSCHSQFIQYIFHFCAQMTDGNSPKPRAHWLTLNWLDLYLNSTKLHFISRTFTFVLATASIVLESRPKTKLRFASVVHTVHIQTRTHTRTDLLFTDRMLRATCPLFPFFDFAFFRFLLFMHTHCWLLNGFTWYHLIAQQSGPLEWESGKCKENMIRKR